MPFMSLLVPLEVLTLTYLKGGYNPIIVISVAVSGMIIGMILNYFFGYIFGRGVLRFFLKDKLNSLEEKIEKFGGWLLFGLCLIPSPIDLFSIVYGSMKFQFKKFIKIVFVGQLIKFVAIYFLFDYIATKLWPMIIGLF